jgi:hypothetical protein
VTTSRRSDEPSSPRTERHTGSLGRNLPLAIASGVALAALFVATLWLSAWLFLAFVGVLIAIALLELDVVLRANGLRPATPVAAAAGLVAFFGAFAAKVLIVRMKRYPVWVIPTAGGLLFTRLIVVWYTSALWFFRTSTSGSSRRLFRVESVDKSEFGFAHSRPSCPFATKGRAMSSARSENRTGAGGAS